MMLTWHPAARNWAPLRAFEALPVTAPSATRCSLDRILFTQANVACRETMLRECGAGQRSNAATVRLFLAVTGTVSEFRLSCGALPS
jgi:hypothetical protein